MHEYPSPQQERDPGDGKRVCCRRVCVSRAYISGSYGKHPADCHILWSAIIRALGSCCLFAVNVGVSPRFAVFCSKNNLKGKEKNEKKSCHMYFLQSSLFKSFHHVFLLIVGYKVLLLRGLSKVLIIFCMSLKNPQFQASRSLHCLKNWSRNC